MQVDDEFLSSLNNAPSFHNTLPPPPQTKKKEKDFIEVGEPLLACVTVT